MQSQSSRLQREAVLKWSQRCPKYVVGHGAGRGYRLIGCTVSPVVQFYSAVDEPSGRWSSTHSNKIEF